MDTSKQYGYKAVGADIIGEITTAPSGNVVLRIGGFAPVAYGVRGWEQRAYVVISPAEALELADHLRQLAESNLEVA